MNAILTPPKLLTAEEYIRLPGSLGRTELRRGVVVQMPPPGFRHGEVCVSVVFYISAFVREHQLGRVVSNDSGIITKRDPDTVRGGDVSYYSYQRVPKDQSPIGYAGASPEIVFEVVSPTNTRGEITTKIGEYLNANVNVVCVVDPDYQIVNLHFPDHPTEKLAGDQPLIFADLPGFSLPVRKLFE